MKKDLSGSYTIEAALVFPFIMGVIVFIIYISFFLHDMTVMKSCAYQAALKGSLIRTSISDMEEEAEKAAQYNIKDLLLATDDLKTEVRISGKDIKVSYSGTLRIPEGLLFMKIVGIDRIEIKGEGTAHQKDAIEFIRKCRSAGNMMEHFRD